MADDVQGAGASPKNEPTHVETTEDAETRAARRELKQSSISDQPDERARALAADDNRPETPSLDVSDEKSDDLKEQVSSPKKKRAHDQLDGEQSSQDNDNTSVTSTDSAKDRATRLEPEKKRHRDEEPPDTTSQALPLSTKAKDSQSQDTNNVLSKPSKEASNATFANSAFGKLASGTSGFAALGSSESGGFASTKPTLSSFASAKLTRGPEATVDKENTQEAVQHPKLSFASNSGLSPFAGLSSGTNGLGSGAFGSTLSGIKPLASFAAPGTKPLQSEKAAKPFGAPESDADDDATENADGDDETQPDDEERGASPEKDADDKKRPRLHKIAVDDGEAGEVTVVSVRAKMFCLDKQAGWKERGAGMLKINVPLASVEFDDNGGVIAGSFDASGLEADDKSDGGSATSSKVARLILRQDQTHRVILNTAILPAMEFQEKASLKSVGILFTAFEGAESKPVSITMRMSAASSRLFLNEIGAIQRELRGN